jgi:hypothetical protein
MRTLSRAIVLLAGVVRFGAGCITEALPAVRNGHTSAGTFALGGGVLFGFIGVFMLVASIEAVAAALPEPTRLARNGTC